MSGRGRPRRDVSVVEARLAIGEDLRARQPEIEQETLARIGLLSRDEKLDPEYAVGLRDSVSIALEYGIQCIESSELSAPPVPIQLYAQARLAARHGVDVGTVIERYVDGYTLLDVFLEEAAEAQGLVGSVALREIRRVSASVLKRLIADIKEQYADEARKRALSHESTRDKRIRELLDGKSVDTTQFNYDFSGFHLGLVTNGQGVERAIKGLAEALDCVAMISKQPGPTWAWLGRRTLPDIAKVEELVAEHWPAGAPLSVGEVGKGITGWRLTHHQANAGLLVSQKRGGFFRYGDDPILATLLQDHLLAESLQQMYIAPLEEEQSGDKLLRTLRAYSAAEHNGTSAAEALGVSRQTVPNHLRTVEDKLGRPLSNCMAELELALRLDELTRLD